MLTRLRISGFKNLIDVDVRLGPFTCIAGANGVGKSNLFDAIQFLSALADKTLMEAAQAVRSEGGLFSDPMSLFYRDGQHAGKSMTFQVEMIVPQEGVDDLGVTALAGATLLEYCLVLAFRHGETPFSFGEFEVVHEQLQPILSPTKADALRFPHSLDWRTSAVSGLRKLPLIETDTSTPQTVIRLRQNDRHGRALSLPTSGLKRTVLSSVTAEYPTAFLARQELRSWRLLQLEPSALREPDPFNAPTTLGTDGSHLPASLFHLALHGNGNLSRDAESSAVLTQIANRLAELIDDVRSVSIDRDDQRQLLTLRVTDRDGTVHPARSLSDGTLRFLALVVLQMQRWSTGVLCFEEPENSIHPARIPAMLRLLQDIAVDTDYPVDQDNPMRQVIINTHSPVVVAQVPGASLLLAEPTRKRAGARVASVVEFRGLVDTWRTLSDKSERPLTLGRLLAYLNPIDSREVAEALNDVDHADSASVRVIDSPTIQTLMSQSTPERQ